MGVSYVFLSDIFRPPYRPLRKPYGSALQESPFPVSEDSYGPEVFSDFDVMVYAYG